jgi:hypothetical protein
MLNVIMLNVIMLNVIVLNVIILNVIILNVIMLNVLEPQSMPLWLTRVDHRVPIIILSLLKRASLLLLQTHKKFYCIENVNFLTQTFFVAKEADVTNNLRL